MRKFTSLLLLGFALGSFAQTPICSPLNSEDNELTDSITTNFSQSNVTYYGIRIWPQDEEYYQKSVENRLYLVLGINDTLVVKKTNSL